MPHAFSAATSVATSCSRTRAVYAAPERGGGSRGRRGGGPRPISGSVNSGLYASYAPTLGDRIMRKVSLIVLVLAACAEPAAAFLCQGIYGPEIPSVGRFILDSPIEIKGVVRKRITFSERGFIFAGDD